MELKIRTEHSAIIIDISGRLDTHTSPELEKNLSEKLKPDEIKKYKAIIVNFKELEYISSSGLRIIVALSNKADKYQKKFLLAEMQETVSNVFEISGLYSIFKIFNTEKEALVEIAG